ncbi:transglutaminase family protein [Qipengyuania atrilutea]|uniref:Transglutaminase family protein n=1 Tax=Qipengyuania atrilutea TaxID=2744473 RepID=A0A850H910_9SPHN|nr:transglutaminase family protein [Actirhodobacter atriluteus]NVD43569.1 transglutaminase family protein [Actirhodobacter atriluteus]
MRLSIRHTTRYQFDDPVVHALQRLRLTPKTTQGQEILDWKMDYTHAHEELHYEDQHHNPTVLVAVEEGAQEVVVECRGMVDTQDNAGVIGRHSGHLPLWSFLGQTRLTRPGDKISAMVEEAARDSSDTVGQLHALSSKIRDRVEYKVGSTKVDTSAEQAMGSAAGVCQDHAHIFIGAARMRGVPARYVSGYLMMNDRIEQEATHAWAEAFVEGLGWVGFDISNGISPDERYVRVATGRDYRDAAPITGISFGSSAQHLHVDVAVEQQQIEQ